jgi:hypothetical protein
MADLVTTQILSDADKTAILKFTNISDGTGETNVVKIDVSTLNQLGIAGNSQGTPCNGVIIQKITASTYGMGVQMLWEADENVLAWVVPANSQYRTKLNEFGGIQNNSGDGKTGNLLFTTIDASEGDVYAVIVECTKLYGY